MATEGEGVEAGGEADGASAAVDPDGVASGLADATGSVPGLRNRRIPPTRRRKAGTTTTAALRTSAVDRTGGSGGRGSGGRSTTMSHLPNALGSVEAYSTGTAAREPDDRPMTQMRRVPFAGT